MIFFNNKKIEYEFPNEIEIDNTKFIIEVNFFKKRSSSVAIKGNKLVFRLSTYLSKKQVDSHFSDLLRNISKKIQKSNFKQESTIEDVLEKGEFYFSNTRYILEYTNKVRGVKLRGNIFYINATSKKENIKKNILKILLNEYKEKIKSYVINLNNQTYNYSIKDIELKLVESKWGHCSHDNKIMLNLKLLNADIDILNYVIFHELSHIRIKNHSPSFWREVSKFCPNYKELRKLLKESPPQIFKLQENEI